MDCEASTVSFLFLIKTIPGLHLRANIEFNLPFQAIVIKGSEGSAAGLCSSDRRLCEQSVTIKIIT
jgi:hypothetical protein